MKNNSRLFKPNDTRYKKINEIKGEREGERERYDERAKSRSKNGIQPMILKIGYAIEIICDVNRLMVYFSFDLLEPLWICFAFVSVDNEHFGSR